METTDAVDVINDVYGLSVVATEELRPGEAIYAHGADDVPVILAHPIAFLGLTVPADKVHGEVMEWIDSKIEQMGAAAERRLDRLVQLGEANQRIREVKYILKTRKDRA